MSFQTVWINFLPLGDIFVDVRTFSLLNLEDYWQIMLEKEA